MNLVSSHVQIMWKDIFLTIVFIYAVRFFVDRYIIRGFKKVHKAFYSNDWNGLENQIEKYQKLSDQFSNGPWNNKIRSIYNTLCAFRASVALVEEKESVFLNQFNQIKKEEEFELKFFVLSLYYRSKGNNEKAIHYYHQFLVCKDKSWNIKCILNTIFSEEKCEYAKEEVDEAIKSFKNPAIIKLLHDNEMFEF